MAFNKPKKEKEAKKMDSGIEDTLDAIRTKFGDDAIMSLGDKPRVDVDVVPGHNYGNFHYEYTKYSAEKEFNIDSLK